MSEDIKPGDRFRFGNLGTEYTVTERVKGTRDDWALRKADGTTTWEYGGNLRSVYERLPSVSQEQKRAEVKEFKAGQVWRFEEGPIWSEWELTGPCSGVCLAASRDYRKAGNTSDSLSTRHTPRLWTLISDVSPTKEEAEKPIATGPCGWSQTTASGVFKECSLPSGHAGGHVYKFATPALEDKHHSVLMEAKNQEFHDRQAAAIKARWIEEQKQPNPYLHWGRTSAPGWERRGPRRK